MKEKMYVMSDDSPVKCAVSLTPEQEAKMAKRTKRIIKKNKKKKRLRGCF